MTVEELIAELSKCKPDLMVIVGGYEGGFDDVTEVVHTSVVLDSNEEDYLGRHEQANGESGRTAILLASNRRQ